VYSTKEALTAALACRYHRRTEDGIQEERIADQHGHDYCGLFKSCPISVCFRRIGVRPTA
jgi:hypothetical protein